MRLMNNLETITAAGVHRLPEDEDFLPNYKRNRTAFTAFCLSFFKTLKDLSRSEKRKYIRREMRINDGFYNNDEDMTTRMLLMLKRLIIPCF